jgi:predicted nucleic acid-binding protein
MSGILIDSNVILDIFTVDPTWYAWSDQKIHTLALQHSLYINPIIYAEVSVHFSQMADLDRLLRPEIFTKISLPWDAAFLAGKCFSQYKKRGGTRTSPLPDFFIGAHAAVSGYTLLTRDATRYRTYFPKLQLIAP